MTVPASNLATTGTEAPAAIRVFTPIARNSISFIALVAGLLLLGVGMLVWMVMFIVQGVKLRDWNCLLALTLLPILWLIFAVPLDVLTQVLRTGGTSTYLRINTHGVLAFSGSATGAVRCIDNPSLEDHDDRIILKTSNMGPIVVYRAYSTPKDIDRLRACVAKYQAQTTRHGPVRTS